MDLAGRVAVVTGAARGIGQAVAVELARRGAAAMLADIAPHADETSAAIAALGGRCEFVRCDVADRSAVEHVMETAIQRLGGVHILVNNAARSFRKPLLEMEPGEAERLFSVTLWGGYHCTQLAARQMVRQGAGGSIVMIGSVHGSRPYPNASAYNGAKAALSHMARTWAVELAAHRIRVNVIEPGWIDTPGEHITFGDEVIRTEGPKLLMGRLGQPAEIARAAAYLASDDASYVTGSVLRVDGGYALTH